MEVTADQFRVYVRAKNKPEYKPPRPGRRRARRGRQREISWYDAAGYCNWLSREAEHPSGTMVLPRGGQARREAHSSRRPDTVRIPAPDGGGMGVLLPCRDRHEPLFRRDGNRSSPGTHGPG